MSSNFSFLDFHCFSEFCDKNSSIIEKWLSDDSVKAGVDLTYLVDSSSVFSSNIEGNNIDLNSYMNQKMVETKFKKKKELAEIDNLVKAYNFALENQLTEENFLVVHRILAKSFLIKSKLGIYRDDRMGVFSTSGLVYVAVEPEKLPEAMRLFWKEFDEISSRNLTNSETFYFAAFFHLRLAQLHPFFDGNGRIARLVEKWFLSRKLGEKAWVIPSERFYKENRAEYYEKINLGVNFYELDFNKAVGFLNLLPQSLNTED